MKGLIDALAYNCNLFVWAARDKEQMYKHVGFPVVGIEVHQGEGLLNIYIEDIHGSSGVMDLSECSDKDMRALI